MNVRVFLIALTLNGPIMTIMRSCDKVNADIMPRAEVLAKREVSPKPYLIEVNIVFGISPKILANQFFKARPLVGLRERLAAILF